MHRLGRRNIYGDWSQWLDLNRFSRLTAIRHLLGWASEYAKLARVCEYTDFAPLYWAAAQRLEEMAHAVAEHDDLRSAELMKKTLRWKPTVCPPDRRQYVATPVGPDESQWEVVLQQNIPRAD